MDAVIIALGSNVGNRHQHLQEAHRFLADLSHTPIRASSIYLTEPVGPSNRYFLNAVVEIQTQDTPKELLKKLKKFEHQHGRDANQPRWSARTIDLDIISFGNLVIQNDSLIIPHPEYSTRLFVLQPIQEIQPHWHDPNTNITISAMIDEASNLQLKKTTLAW